MTLKNPREFRYRRPSREANFEVNDPLAESLSNIIDEEVKLAMKRFKRKLSRQGKKEEKKRQSRIAIDA